jgi:hypothetical protein
MRALQNHQLLNSSASAEWFTPPRYIEAVRAMLSAIGLDPASSEEANRIVGATRYYTQELEGSSMRMGSLSKIQSGSPVKNSGALLSDWRTRMESWLGGKPQNTARKPV